MIKNELSLIIQRPVHEVFDYISDLENACQLQPGLLDVRRITEGPLGVGTRFQSVRKFMGRRLESGFECVVFDLNKKIAIKSFSGPSPFRQSFTFEPIAEGTRLGTIFEMEISGLVGLAEPLISSSMRREMQTKFLALKELLESRVVEAFELLE